MIPMPDLNINIVDVVRIGIEAISLIAIMLWMTKDNRKRIEELEKSQARMALDVHGISKDIKHALDLRLTVTRDHDELVENRMILKALHKRVDKLEPSNH